MTRLSATTLISFIVFAATTAVACSSADTGTPTGSDPTCTNCATSAVVADPVPSASSPASLAAVPPIRVGERVEGAASTPTAVDAGAATSDVDSGAAAPPDSDGGTCVIIEHDAGPDHFEWEVRCN